MAEKQQQEESPKKRGAVNETSDDSDDSIIRSPRRRQRTRHRRSSDRPGPPDEVIPDEVVIRDPPVPVDRPERGRRRHYAGARNRQPPDEREAALILGVDLVDNFAACGGLPDANEGPPSSRGRLSPGAGPRSESTAGPSTDQDNDCYMASASDCDETARPDAIGVADRRNRIAGNNNPAPEFSPEPLRNPSPLPEPEPMSLSSDPECDDEGYSYEG